MPSIVYNDPDLHKRFKIYCVQNNITINDAIIRTIQYALDNDLLNEIDEAHREAWERFIEQNPQE